MMTNITTEAVERLMNDTTPGPWVEVIELDRDGDDDAISLWADIVCVHRCGLGFDGGIDDIIKANARFIAAARELVPALLAERDRLASLLAASKSPDPVTNADSCQPTRTYEDGVRDALAMAISTIEDQFPGALYASNRTKCIALIKEKSHE